MVTCYDYSASRVVAETNVDCILVGDSLAMTMYGQSTSLGATTTMIALHTAAVARGAPDKFIVADLPFLSCLKGLKDAMDAVQDLMSAGAHAVSSRHARTCRDRPAHRRLRRARDGASRPHAQSVNLLGGTKVQARTDAAAEILAAQTIELQAAGSFSLVLECVPSEAAR